MALPLVPGTPSMRKIRFPFLRFPAFVQSSFTCANFVYLQQDHHREKQMCKNHIYSALRFLFHCAAQNSPLNRNRVGGKDMQFCCKQSPPPLILYRDGINMKEN